MRFTKMQGLGNDYLYVYGEVPEDIEELSRKLSDRHFGAGSDGMIYISPSQAADFKMRIFNADGSEAKMCGNGIRCVGKYVYDKGYTDKTFLTVETLSGIKMLHLHLWGGKVKSVTVGMGKCAAGEDMDLAAGGEKVVCTPVDVGNPHAVIFVKDAEGAPVTELGPAIEKHSAFPGGVNVEFVQVLAANKLRMRVWERGSGVTVACGTGACASAAAAVGKGFCEAGEPVTVTLDGGDLKVTVESDGTVMMSGPAEFVYEGEVSL
ncbi:MAG: diaminopimelate epimerase [Firmicutes bacterium]|nr:diaminopimelate epimerase [Bacillota bacterium]